MNLQDEIKSIFGIREWRSGLPELVNRQLDRLVQRYDIVSILTEMDGFIAEFEKDVEIKSKYAKNSGYAMQDHMEAQFKLSYLKQAIEYVKNTYR